MVANVILVVSLSVFVYWLAPRVIIDPRPVPLSEDILIPSNDVNRISWNEAERKFPNKIIGPESLTHNPETGEIYTGTVDGMIWRISKDLASAEPIIRIGEDHPKCGSIHVEEICGRVLGLKFVAPDKLIVADAYHGIIAIHLNKRTKQVLVQPDKNMDTRSIKLFNSVDVSKSGVIYFTVFSMKWNLKGVFYSLMEAENSGRVYSYNLLTQKLKVIASNLYMANGISLSQDENSLIVCEFFKRRLLKFNLLRPKEEPTVFIDKLPGFPDNIKRDNTGNYYVAMPFTDSVAIITKFNQYPYVSKFIALIVPTWVINLFISPNSQVYKINHLGQVVGIIDGTRPGIDTITEAYEVDGKILLGNLNHPYIDVIIPNKSV